MNTNIKHLSVPGFFLILFFASVSTLYSANVSVEVQENIDVLITTNQCVDCNLAGADLNRSNLSGADLRGADLSNATFFLADLSNADLSGAILRGTQFGGADLADADLRKADLRGVKIAGAYLVGSQFDGSFSDVAVSDDSDVQEIVEKTYIPDDSVSKKVVDNKQVNIADRRDFGPVPPQIDPSIETAPDTQQGGPVKQSAPPKKMVSPVKEITLQPEISDNEDNISKQDATEVSPDQQESADQEDSSMNPEITNNVPKEESATDSADLSDQKVETAGVSVEESKDRDPETADMAKNYGGETAPEETEPSVDEQPILIASKIKQSPTPEETLQKEPDDSNDSSRKDEPLQSDLKEESTADSADLPDQKVEAASVSDGGSKDRGSETADKVKNYDGETAPEEIEVSVDEQPILIASKIKQSPTPEETLQKEPDDSNDSSRKDEPLQSDLKEESTADSADLPDQKVEAVSVSDGGSKDSDSEKAEMVKNYDGETAPLETEASVDEQPIFIASESKQSPTPEETVQKESDDSNDSSMKDESPQSDLKEESVAKTPVSDVQKVESADVSDEIDAEVDENKVIVESRQENDAVLKDSEVADAEKLVEERSLDVDEDVQQVASKSMEDVTNDVSQDLLEQQKRLSKYKKCYNCNLAGSDFSGKNLDGADLEGSDFTGANLEKADFENANLKGVSFRNANLKNAKFNKADLYKADFTGADLTGAEFNKALTDETNFQDTIGYGSLMINQPE